MTEALYDRAQRAVQVITPDGAAIEAGRACLLVLERIGWHPRLARSGRHRPFIWAVEIGYRAVARYRDRIGSIMFRHEDERGLTHD